MSKTLRLIILWLVKIWRTNCSTHSPMCGDAASCIKVNESRHCLRPECVAKKVSNVILYLLDAKVHVTRPLWATSSKNKSPRINVTVNPQYWLIFIKWSGISWKALDFPCSRCNSYDCLKVPLRYKHVSSLHRICYGYGASTSTLARNVNANVSCFFLSMASNC